MLYNFYGRECPHCIKMEPLLAHLEKETGIVIERREVWHDLANAQLLSTFDKNLCGGVPFLYNTDTAKFICGEADYEELEAWAGV